MKFPLFLVLLFLLFCLSALSQQPVVVVQDGDGNPLPMVLVDILDTAKTKSLINGQSRNDGVVHFIGKIPAGVYPTHLYQVNTKEEVMIDGVDYTRKSVVLTMGMKTQDLEEVTVTSVRQRVKMDAKGASLDIGLLPHVKLLTLEDALRTIPGIDFNSEGITYQGQVVRFKENGFQSSNIDLNISDYLSMPASNFTDVKVLLKDLSLQGDGPSIDLIRAKRSDKDIWGNLNGRADLYAQGISGHIGIMEKKSLFEISPGFNIQNSPETNSISHTQWTDRRSRENFSRSDSENSLRTGSVNLHYNLNLVKHLFNVNLMLNSSERDTRKQSFFEEYQQDTLYNRYLSYSGNDIFTRKISFNAGYIRNINKASKFTLLFNGELPALENQSGMQTPEHNPKVLEYSQKRMQNDRNYYSFASYELNCKNLGQIEIGAKYFNRSQKITGDYIWFDRGINGDSIQHSQYRNNYNYAAVFASLSRVIGKYSAFFVLNANYSDDRIPTVNDESYNYFTLSPFLSLYRNFNGHAVRLTLGYQEKRPSIFMLNPMTDPTMTPTGLTILEGNPELSTAKQLSAGSSYSTVLLKKIRTSLNLNYSYSWDDFQNVNFSKDSIFVRKYFNVSSKQSIALSGNLDYTISKRMSSLLSFNLSYYSLHLDKDFPASADFSYRGQFNLSYALTDKLLAGVYTTYSKQASFQTSDSHYWSTGFIFSFKPADQWNFNLNCMEFIRPELTRKYEIHAIGYDSFYETTYKQLNVMLSIQYSFGKAKTSRKPKDIPIDDM